MCACVCVCVGGVLCVWGGGLYACIELFWPIVHVPNLLSLQVPDPHCNYSNINHKNNRHQPILSTLLPLIFSKCFLPLYNYNVVIATFSPLDHFSERHHGSCGGGSGAWSVTRV